MKTVSSANDLYDDPVFIRKVLFNIDLNSGNDMLFIYNNQLYSFSNPLAPYGNIESALIGGTLNSLFKFVSRNR